MSLGCLAQPTPRNVERIVRQLQSRQSPPDRFGSVQDPLKVCIDRYPEPDAKSKSQRPMAWHADFADEAAASPERGGGSCRWAFDSNDES